MIKQVFTDLCDKYSDNVYSINEFWIEIENQYSEKNRFYHTLSHLENLFEELSEIKNKIENWDVILFSLFYHDIVYDVLKNDNEEQSALIANKRLKEISIPNELIQKTNNQILATKKHEVSNDFDTNYFLDADLSILGKNQEKYLLYSENIRKEYAIYPEEIYNYGRRKVLNHFLEMSRIYKTDFFYDKFENQAKLNLEFELNLLK